MKHLVSSLFLAAVWLIAISSGASAHPHVWVTIHTDVIYDAKGQVTGLRHAWTFDEMFSTYAIQGIDHKKKGLFTREELSGLAEVNVTSLKEFDYFTFPRADGKKVPLLDPTDYWMEYKDPALTLHFVLPFKTPVAARRLQVEIYDPTIFVDFEPAKDTPVTVVNAPASCQLQVDTPHTPTAGEQLRLGQLDAAPLDPFSSFGEIFANKFVVNCP